MENIMQDDMETGDIYRDFHLFDEQRAIAHASSWRF